MSSNVNDKSAKSNPVAVPSSSSLSSSLSPNNDLHHGKPPLSTSHTEATAASLLAPTSPKGNASAGSSVSSSSYNSHSYGSSYGNSTRLTSPTRGRTKRPERAIDPSKCFLLRLPTEILIQVLSHLDPVDLQNTSHSCRSLHNLMTDESCWRQAFERYFGNLPAKRVSNSWRKEYILRSRLTRRIQSGKFSALQYALSNGPIHSLTLLLPPYSDTPRLLATNLQRGTIVSSDPTTGRILRETASAHSDGVQRAVRDMVVDSTGTRMAILHMNEDVGIVSNIRKTPSYKLLDGHHDGGSQIQWTSVQSKQGVVLTKGYRMSWRPDALGNITPTHESSIWIWDVGSGKCIAICQGDAHEFTHMSSDARHHVVGITKSGKLFVYNVDLTALVHSTPGNSSSSLNLHQEPATQPKLLAASHGIQVLDGEPSDLVYDGAVSTAIVSAKQGSDVYIVDVSTGIITHRLSCPVAPVTGSTTTIFKYLRCGEPPSISSPSLTPSNFSSTPPNTVSFAPKSPHSSFGSHGSSGMLSPGVRVLICAGTSDGRVVIWDTRVNVSGSSQSYLNLLSDPSKITEVVPHSRVLNGHLTSITALNIDPIKVVSASSDGSVNTWCTVSGRLLRCMRIKPLRMKNQGLEAEFELAGESETVPRLCEMRKGRVVLSIRGSVKIWDWGDDTTYAQYAKTKSKRRSMRSRVVHASSQKQQLAYDVRDELWEMEVAEMEEERLNKWVGKYQRTVAASSASGDTGNGNRLPNSRPPSELNEFEMLEFVKALSVETHEREQAERGVGVFGSPELGIPSSTAKTSSRTPSRGRTSNTRGRSNSGAEHDWGRGYTLGNDDVDADDDEDLREYEYIGPHSRSGSLEDLGFMLDDLLPTETDDDTGDGRLNRKKSRERSGRKLVFGSGISSTRRSHNGDTGSPSSPGVTTRLSSSYEYGNVGTGLGNGPLRSGSYHGPMSTHSWGGRQEVDEENAQVQEAPSERPDRPTSATSATSATSSPWTTFTNNRRSSRNSNGGVVYEKVSVVTRSPTTLTGMSEDEELQYVLELSKHDK